MKTKKHYLVTYFVIIADDSDIQRDVLVETNNIKKTIKQMEQAWESSNDFTHCEITEETYQHLIKNSKIIAFDEKEIEELI